MKVLSNVLCWVLIAAPLGLTSCSNGANKNGIFASPDYIAVAISPRVLSVPEGGSVIFTATVSNNLSLPKWSLLAAGNTTDAGSLSAVSGSTNTILYKAPQAPPIYDNSLVPTGLTQGAVTVDATTTAPPGTSSPIQSDALTFIITAPFVTVNLSPTNADVALGATLQFVGYAIGNVNYGLTWQVNGVTGGLTTAGKPGPYGSISTSGLYTAPPVVPVLGNSVTITMISQADPTKTASALISLQ